MEIGLRPFGGLRHSTIRNPADDAFVVEIGLRPFGGLRHDEADGQHVPQVEQVGIGLRPFGGLRQPLFQASWTYAFFFV